MQYGNWWLIEQLERMRYEEIRREIAHRRFMAEHGLDLWTALRRAIGQRLTRSSAATAQPAPATRADEDTPTTIAA